MSVLRLFWAMMNWMTKRILPVQLQPGYIFPRIRSRLEAWAGKFEQAADKAHVDKDTVKKPWLRPILYFLAFVALLAALWWINSLLDLDKVLRSPWPRLHHYWLPILFVLGCTLYWLGRKLWHLLAPEQITSEFPDIDEAWEEGIAALRQAGIAPAQVPMFLVLGRPQSSTKQLFEASQMNFPVRHVPRKLEAPLHFTATLDAIFVTCEGASLLGQQAALLTDTGANGAATAPQTKTEAEMESIHPPVIEYDTEHTHREEVAVAMAREAATATPVLLLADETSEALKLRKARVPLLKQGEEVARLTARLVHLGRLIVRQRSPYCPINGILIVLPLAATNSVEDASQTGAICQHDLDTLRAILQVHCPKYALIADMEAVPGFCELLDRFPDAKQRQYVLGQPFPLMPDLETQDVPRTIGRGVEWLFDTLFPTNVYRLLRMESPGKEERSAAVRANSQLFELLTEMRERHRRIYHLLTRGVASNAEGPLLFGGCYLAATGADPVREQAFVHGVLIQLIENQNYVSWTKEALEEERDYRRWANVGYLVLFVVLAIAVTMGYLYWPRK